MCKSTFIETIKKITFVNISTFFANIATVVGVVYAGFQFRQYRYQQCSEAAANLLGLFNLAIDDIKEIVYCPELFAYPHIDEDMMISLNQPKEKLLPFLAKPPRMIKNVIRNVKKESYPLIAKISGKDASKLNGIITKVDKYAISLCGAIGAKLEENEDHIQAPANQDILKNYETQLEAIRAELKEVLIPIIEKWGMFKRMYKNLRKRR